MASNTQTSSTSSQKATFKGLLFDMDGTIIDSTDAVVKHWHTIGAEIGVDPEVILKTSHGRRSIDTLKELGRHDLANWEYVKRMEGLLPENYGDDATEIPGARDLLDQIQKESLPWAIVTSGTSPLVGGWLKVLSLPIPKNLVVAEDVPEGKPDPACYLMGMEKLGLKDGKEVLVFEDSPAGILAGKRAGCKVLGLVTSHTFEQVAKAAPDWIVRDLSSVKITGVSEKSVELEFSDILTTVTTGN